jgi:hypothetical protein
VNTTARLALASIAAVLSTGVALWLLLGSIEPTTYFEISDELEQVGEWLLWASAVGQTLFVVLWMTMPWWRHWVGRALMVKSIALGIYLDFALVHNYIDPYPALPLLGVILFGFITIGIWTQLATLAHEAKRPTGNDEDPPR